MITGREKFPVWVGCLLTSNVPSAEFRTTFQHFGGKRRYFAGVCGWSSSCRRSGDESETEREREREREERERERERERELSEKINGGLAEMDEGKVYRKMTPLNQERVAIKCSKIARADAIKKIPRAGELGNKSSCANLCSEDYPRIAIPRESKETCNRRLRGKERNNNPSGMQDKQLEARIFPRAKMGNEGIWATLSTGVLKSRRRWSEVRTTASERRGWGETGDPRENPPTSGVVRHNYPHAIIRQRPRRESNPVLLGGRRACVELSLLDLGRAATSTAKEADLVTLVQAPGSIPICRSQLHIGRLLSQWKATIGPAFSRRCQNTVWTNG
ncbi:hypothetical protein PR048_030060 [Dryococelus australis]|uniref:Uncharacterized protein n=1 Tax=Dryococelus australis TaxID=614101 RepID=A0ABQ9G8P8_9NEOP|nr:hypothetical protein PR048_030060 [Dryococelus australis]